MTGKLHLALKATGVPGFDAVLGGGLPELSMSIISGEPGSGKTTLAQQMMFSMATPAHRALFFNALGEPPMKMLRYQQQFSFFDFDKVDGAIRYLDLGRDLLEGDYEHVLAKIIDEVHAFAPSLVIIDSFRSLMHVGAAGPHQIASLQLFVRRLALQMAGWNATTFLIGDYQPEELERNPIFTIADGIFWLRQSVCHNIAVRKLQVIKMRGVGQAPGLHTFRISRDGIEVFQRTAASDALHRQPDPRGAGPLRRLSSGVPTLDAMMGGGVPAGHSVLIVGPSGAGKTRLATQFLLEGVRQGEPGAIALFEKSPHQMIDRSLIELVQDGRLGMLNMRSLDLSIDETIHELLKMIANRKAMRIVFDSLSAFELALAPEFRAEFRESLHRMVGILAERGVTTLMTSELEDRFDELRFSPYGTAFLTDGIIMQRYFEMDGQLKTLISVVKMRGSAHSRDLRLFEVTPQGVVIGEQALPYANLLAGKSSAIADEARTRTLP